MRRARKNLDFLIYTIKNTKPVYGLESSGEKDIEITKSDDGHELLNDIEYDGVTDLFCDIKLNENKELSIQFRFGESCHGSSSYEKLDSFYDKPFIDSIIMAVKSDKGFNDFCKYVDFLQNLPDNGMRKIKDEYGRDAFKGYYIAEKDGYDVLELIDFTKVDIDLPVTYNKEIVRALASGYRDNVIDMDRSTVFGDGYLFNTIDLKDLSLPEDCILNEKNAEKFKELGIMPEREPNLERE